MPGVVAASPSGTFRPLGSAVREALDRPLSPAWCAAGWLLATVLFAGLVAATGGPGTIDSSESIYTTWAIAHGQLACAYPSVTLPHEPLIAPVYPLLSGALAAVAHVGQSATVPFPSRGAMGPNCTTAIAAMRPWAFRSGAGAFLATRWIACSGWLVLMAGIVAWLRAAGRGRRGWEPATLLVVACLPPAFLTVSFYLHPQDLVALGLALGAMACAVRGRWLSAGIFVGLAVLSQQYALLVAAPLIVLAPTGRRGRLVAGAAGASAIVVAPFLAAGSPGVLRAIALGSGDSASVGGTVVWHLTHQGASAVLVSRVMPLLLALALAVWLGRRLGPAALTPAVLGSLVAVCLSLRLLFEQNLFAYYFMALMVALVLADVVRGRIRGSLVAWVATLTMVFCLDGPFLRVTSSLHGQDVIPPLVLFTAIGTTVYGVVRGRRWSAWNRFLWAAVGLCAVITWPLTTNPLFLPAPIFMWQLAFAGTGALLGAGPLLDDVRDRRRAVEGTSYETEHERPAPLAPFTATS
jgi:hypothetical protein